jgi:hypothetical protein
LALQTSQLYKEAINSLSRTSYISGTLTTKSGRKINITNETIEQGSLYITNQCVNSDSFSYGSVFAAEMGITLKTEFDRYSLYGAEIVLNYNILLSNNEYESIPLGKFYVNEPNRVGKNISIKGYDKMVDLDVELDISTTGTPYELLSLMSEKFGFELAQPQKEIDELVNGTQLISAMQDRISTYRELLSYIGCVTCSFAAFNSYGKLKMYTYQKEVSRTINAQIRSASSFSDFETYYSAVSAMFVVDGGLSKFVATDDELSGLIYDMGEIPAIQGLEESNQQVIDDIFNELSQVKYTPSEISFIGDPSIELGDMVKYIDREGNEVTSLITFYKWSYRGRHQLKSAGSNPKLSGTREQKKSDLSGLQAEIQAKTVAVYSFTNAAEYSCKGGDLSDPYSMKEVITLTFAPNTDTTAIFIATINFMLDVDGLVEFKMFIDSVPQDTSVWSQYCHKGANTISLMECIACSSEAASYKVSIFCKTEAVISDIRQVQADILTSKNANNSIISALSQSNSLPLSITYDTVEPITTVPTATIKKGFVKAAVFGQGLSAKAPWDGTITVFDEILKAAIESNLSVTGVKDIVNSVSTQIPIPTTLRSNISSVGIVSNLLTTIINDEMILDEVISFYTFDVSKANDYEYDRNCITIENNNYALKTNYEYSFVEEEINTGKLYSVKLITNDKSTIESVVVTSE